MTPYDKDPTTWAWIYDQVWKGFTLTVDKISEDQKMPNRYFFRETFIDYLYKRHKEDKYGDSTTSPTAK
jgi:hypothetical protein